MATKSMGLNQQEFATFLRNRRARVLPEQVGLPHGLRRRTPGLRREEVAMLVGVSPEWYTWLEQGRDIQISTQLLENLARVLRLDPNEREYVFLLVFRQPPPVMHYTAPTISPIVQQALDQFGLTPACAVDNRLNIVAWNATHQAVFGDNANQSERERNLIWRLFTALHDDQTNSNWLQIAQIYVGQFRAGYGRFITDPWWAEQIAALSALSPLFQDLWARQDVINIAEGRKAMQHTVAGKLDFNFLWLQTVANPDLRLLLHLPQPNSGTAEKLANLLSPLEA